MQQVPVFRPTAEEFAEGFTAYVKKIEPQCSAVGLARVIPPAGWAGRRLSSQLGSAADQLDVEIPKPIQQKVAGGKGVFQTMNIIKPAQKLAAFRKAALAFGEKRGECGTDKEVERKFWKSVRFEPPTYGADFEGSLFEEDLQPWAVPRLEGCILKYLGATVKGVTTPFLYFGMWKALFGWHTEDMDLFSINYLHFGAPKHWYCVPPPARAKFERLARSFFPEHYRECPEFLRHKTTLISPFVLLEEQVPLYTTVQREGEFMITFPGAYHAGFNHGFNCAESLNFATESWIPHGLRSSWCKCRGDSVHINMGVFIANYNLMEPTPYLIDDAVMAEADNQEEEAEGQEEEEEEEEAGDSEMAEPSPAPLVPRRVRMNVESGNDDEEMAGEVTPAEADEEYIEEEEEGQRPRIRIRMSSTRRRSDRARKEKKEWPLEAPKQRVTAKRANKKRSQTSERQWEYHTEHDEEAFLEDISSDEEEDDGEWSLENAPISAEDLYAPPPTRKKPPRTRRTSGAGSGQESGPRAAKKNRGGAEALTKAERTRKVVRKRSSTSLMPVRGKAGVSKRRRLMEIITQTKKTIKKQAKHGNGLMVSAIVVNSPLPPVLLPKPPTAPAVEEEQLKESLSQAEAEPALPTRPLVESKSLVKGLPSLTPLLACSLPSGLSSGLPSSILPASLISVNKASKKG